ncbi:MAG: KH domain-containing protein [Trueperaceae bacterium]
MPLDLVTFILQNLVAEPDRLEVHAERTDRMLHIEVRCAPDDTGRIIGRGGRVINAVRTLARAAADGRQRVEVQLLE